MESILTMSSNDINTSEKSPLDYVRSPIYMNPDGQIGISVLLLNWSDNQCLIKFQYRGNHYNINGIVRRDSPTGRLEIAADWFNLRIAPELKNHALATLEQVLHEHPDWREFRERLAAGK